MSLHVYMIEAERIGPVVEGKQRTDKERCFVEAGSISAAISIRPEHDGYEIVSIVRVGNIIARESVSRNAKESEA